LKTALIAISILLALSFILMAYGFVNAVDGYEDDDGFHFENEKDKK